VKFKVTRSVVRRNTLRSRDGHEKNTVKTTVKASTHIALGSRLVGELVK
jgi:hypothetical protein